MKDITTKFRDSMRGERTKSGGSNGEKFVCVLFSMLLISLPLLICAAAVETKSFEGKGVAPLQGYDIKTARNLAIKKGARAALDDAAGSLLNLKTFTEKHDSIEQAVLNEPKKYITNVMTLSEERKGNNYEVVVSADVNMNLVKSELIRLGLLLPPDKMPVWMVVISERAGNAAPQSAWIGEKNSPSYSESLMNGFIGNYGYRVIERKNNDAPIIDAQLPESEKAAKAIKAAENMGAAYLLVGECVFVESAGVSNKDYRLNTARLTMTLYEVSSGNALQETESMVSIELPPDPENPKRAIRAVIVKLDDEMTEWLQLYNPSGAAGYVKVKIDFYGFTNYGMYIELTSALDRDIDGVRKVTLVSLGPGEAEIDIQYAREKGSELVQKLIEYSFKSFRLQPAESKNGKYFLKVIPIP